ncbi:MAG: hypothetical protein ACYC5X_09525 [Syntrophales bacterium]
MVDAIPELIFKPWRKMPLAEVKGEILEIGVGTGQNFPHYPSGACVTGIDIADGMVERLYPPFRACPYRQTGNRLAHGSPESSACSHHGANINRRTIENVRKAGLRVESVEHLELMNMVKMISAKTDKA